ncbi:MAG: hypothetical protein ACRCXV_09720 [Bacteroidales bacterium]
MQLSKTCRLFLLSAPALLWSCSDDSVVTDKTESEKEPAEIIIPVDFRYLTLNKEGSYSGQTASVSYVHKNGSVFPDYYKTVNGEQILCDPNAAYHFKDKLYLAYGSNWNDNGIAVLEGNSFKKVDQIELKRSMTPNAIEWLGGDSLIVAGRYKDENINGFIADVSKDAKLKRKIDFGFTVYAIKKIGDKIFILGCKDNKNGEALQPKLMVADIKNIHESAFRTIKSNLHLSSRSSAPCVDKNGNLWFGAIENDEQVYKLFCIDTKTESIKHSLKMPLTMSTLNEMAFSISNDGQTIYLRNHKAFYTVNVDKPAELDEPVFEYMKHVGTLCDLKTTQEGNLLFINQVLGASSPSEVIEVKPEGAQWNILKTIEVGESAKSIYLSKYEK